jgi:deoxyribose-phosphate aldolase
MGPGGNRHPPRDDDDWGRQILTVPGLAARLEHRLHQPQTGPAELAGGCTLAAEAGLAAVLCRPEHVPEAAGRLAGTDVDVVTILGFHDPCSPRRSPPELAREAEELTAQGATELALVATPGTMPSAGTGFLVEQIDAVTEVTAPSGTRVRTLLNTTSMSDDEIRATCQAMVEAGIHLIQGGSIRGDRTAFSQVEVMRSAMPRSVLLKWTQPVRSVQAMLVSLAVGVDRFNGDPAALIQDASRQIRVAPLRVPVSGVDF